MDARIGG
jgi:uncharacterized protein YjbI with pentapeptide repeats